MRCKLIVACLSVTMLLVNANMTAKLESSVQLLRVKDARGVLSPSFLGALVSLSKASVFIETGTYLGETSARAACFFDEVYTIELDKELFERATNLYRDIANLHIYHGHSPALLKQIIQGLGHKKIIFWLDAHYSGPGTARAESNTPILGELAAIRKSGIQDAIILIDDMRIFAEFDHMPTDITHQGYPSIETLIQTIKLINPAYTVSLFDDIAMAVPKLVFG